MILSRRWNSWTWWEWQACTSLLLDSRWWEGYGGFTRKEINPSGDRVGECRHRYGFLKCWRHFLQRTGHLARIWTALSGSSWQYRQFGEVGRVGCDRWRWRRRWQLPVRYGLFHTARRQQLRLCTSKQNKAVGGTTWASYVVSWFGLSTQIIFLPDSLAKFWKQIWNQCEILYNSL